MRTTYIINSNQGYTNWIWNYGKQTVKGLGVMSLGVLGYMGLRGYWRSDNPITQTNSESTDLVSATDESTSVIKKDLTNTPVPAAQNIWNSVEQSLQYRRKRGVVPVGGEFQVNTNTTNNGSPAIASLPTGEFVITWSTSSNIFAQRFDVNGTRLGIEFQANTNTTNVQYPAIASLTNGEFVIAWQGDQIYAQRFDINGTRLGNEFQANTNISTTYVQNPGIARLPNDEFVITWVYGGGIGSGLLEVHAQCFDANGTRLGNEFQANTNISANYVQNPGIASLPNGEFVITWQCLQDINNINSGVIYAQRFDVDGTRLGNEFQVDTNTTSDLYPAIASLSNGEFVITWQSNNVALVYSSIFAQRFDINGVRLGDEFQVNTNTIGNQYAAIASLPNDEFIITWQGASKNGAYYQIYAQRFDVNGVPIGSEFQVSTNTAASQQLPVIASFPNGGFIITWQSAGIYARIFTTIYTPPQLNCNLLTIGQGQILVLTSSQLLAFSESVSANNLVLLASNVIAGWFAYVNNSILPIFNFTQTEVNNGQIQFTQDDSYNVPSYQIAVFDGTNMTVPQSVVINFDQKPQWINQQLMVRNGEETLLSPDQLLAIDDRNNSQVSFDVQNVTHGVFAFSAAADPFTNAINSFTQLQVNASQVRFAHDNSGIAPTYQIRASDGRLFTVYQPSQIIFIPNLYPPVLTRNELAITQGQQRVLAATDLSATDLDLNTTEALGRLVFNFTFIQQGQFQLTSAVGHAQAVTWAYQRQVQAGELIFKHDGSPLASSYNVTVFDGLFTSPSERANITFTLLPPDAQSVPTVVGASIGGISAALLLAGAGIFGAYRYRRSKQLEEQRANNPLANALYHELKIPGTEDFQSEKGIAFTNAVDSLNNELIRADIDIKQMVPEEITELAYKLAAATKAQLGKKINPLDIQDVAQGIVATAMTLSGKNLIDSSATELEVVKPMDRKRRALLAKIEKDLNIDLDAMSLDEINALSLNDINMLAKPLLDSDESAQLKI